MKYGRNANVVYPLLTVAVFVFISGCDHTAGEVLNRLHKLDITIDIGLGGCVRPPREPDESKLTPGMEYDFGGITFCWMPPGAFMMGRFEGEQNSWAFEGPQHEVVFERGFWLSKHPITQDQWYQVMETDPSFFVGGDKPVDSVSWNDIAGSNGFLARLNEAHPGRNFRLPSEAEWEYAYRAGTDTRYYWGDDLEYERLDEHAWFSGNNGRWGQPDYGPKPVGTKPANPWNLYDMAGNVWEWCADDWFDNHLRAPGDGSARISEPRGASRVIRGSYWGSSATHLRAAYRRSGTPGSDDVHLGFRIARTPR